MEEKTYVTQLEAAAILGVTELTFIRWRRRYKLEKHIVTIPVGKRLVWHRDSLKTFRQKYVTGSITRKITLDEK